MSTTRHGKLFIPAAEFRRMERARITGRRYAPPLYLGELGVPLPLDVYPPEEVAFALATKQLTKGTREMAAVELVLWAKKTEEALGRRRAGSHE